MKAARWVAGLLLALAGLCGASACTPDQPTPPPAVQTDDEDSGPDCDLEDALTGDSDCYGDGHKPKSGSKSTPTSGSKSTPKAAQPKPPAKPRTKRR